MRLSTSAHVVYHYGSNATLNHINDNVLDMNRPTANVGTTNQSFEEWGSFYKNVEEVGRFKWDTWHQQPLNARVTTCNYKYLQGTTREKALTSFCM